MKTELTSETITAIEIMENMDFVLGKKTFYARR